jgi:hypothetical protein
MPMLRMNTPLRLADGTLIYPDVQTNEASSAPIMVEVPTPDEAQRIVVAARRKLSELPEVPKTMNAVSVILSYTLFGLDVEEIAIATGLSIDQISRIKQGDAYRQMNDTVVRSVLDSETNVVRDLFVKQARNAAGVIVRAMEEGTRADRISAAKDILDRSGHRPSDVVEHRHKLDGGLVIEIVRKEVSSLPVIDMEAE